MVLLRWLNYLVGNLLIAVQGDFIERFINLTTSRGIELWDLRRLNSGVLLARVRVDAFRPLRHVARVARCRVRIKERYGFPFILAKVKRRQLLMTGAVAFAIGLYVLSSYVWWVGVTGTAQVSSRRISEVAAAHGLKPGVWKKKVDLRLLEEQIADEIPEVAFVGIRFKGTLAIIEVSEKILPPEAEGNSPMNIVAAKDGLISEVLAIIGQPAVKAGDTVRRGQILISGTVAIKAPNRVEANPGGQSPPGADIIKHVRARGIVRARVWYTGSGSSPIIKINRIATGQVKRLYGIKYRQKEIILTGPRQAPFKHYRRLIRVISLPEWRNIKIPVELFTISYQEVNEQRINLGRDGAYLAARLQALQAARRQIPPKVKVANQKVTVLPSVDANLIMVRTVVETREEIGLEQAFDPGAGPPATLPEEGRAGSPPG